VASRKDMAALGAVPEGRGSSLLHLPLIGPGTRVVCRVVHGSLLPKGEGHSTSNAAGGRIALVGLFGETPFASDLYPTTNVGGSPSSGHRTCLGRRPSFSALNRLRRSHWNRENWVRNHCGEMGGLLRRREQLWHRAAWPHPLSRFGKERVSLWKHDRPPRVGRRNG
jgi:hypothetical protein